MTSKVVAKSNAVKPSKLKKASSSAKLSQPAKRGLLKITNGDIGNVAILKPDGARPTRPNALEAGLRVYSSDVKQILPNYVVDTSQAGSTERIFGILQKNNIVISGIEREDRFQEVPLQVVKDIVQLVPIRDDDSGRWDTAALLALLTATAGQYNDKGTIYVRPFKNNKLVDVQRRRIRGALSGDEVGWAQATKRFTLVLIYWGDASAPSGWYPHIVVPADLPPHVFNPF